MPSLLLSEARARAHLLSITATHVALDLTDVESTFASVTTITFTCSEPGSSTFVDFKGDRLNQATLNGAEIDVSTWGDGRLPLHDLAVENTLVLDGLMSFADDGEGLHRHVDPADGQTYLYAMSFLDAAPKWFGCFDQPDLKSRYTIEVSAPAAWTVVGNGPVTTSAPGHWRIDVEQPLSTYFVTLVAGPYVSRCAEHDGIPLGLHVRASLADQLAEEAEDVFAVTRACLDYFHSVFGVRYPFGEYHQAFVPDFNAGAMENPGCVTFRDTYIFRAAVTTAERGTRASTIAHEMAHMWFGDLVTMRWWDDLWLNESFAEYMGNRVCTEATDYAQWVEFGIGRKDWGLVADQAPSTHPVAGNGAADAQSALNAFDGISYAKGAAVLRQLVSYLGDEVFFGGLNDYFAAHAYGNAEMADLLAAWERHGAKDLDAWVQGWLRAAGPDTIDAKIHEGSAVLRRQAPADTAAQRPHAFSLAGLSADGVEQFRVPVRVDADESSIALPQAAELLVPDAADETWSKVRFGSDGWSAIGPLLPRIDDALTRIVVCNSIRDGVRDAELDPEEALSYVVDHVVSEPRDILVRSMLGFARVTLAGPFCPPDRRADRMSRVHRAALMILERAEPGSDLQLAALREAIRSSDQHDELAGWLRAELPDGLSLDSELIWAIVTRLTGITGDEALIEATLRDDPSSAGHTHAAHARAGLPLAIAKERAWALLMEPSSAPAYEVYATGDGFFDPAQNELTAPYAERFFAEIGGTQAFRGGWALGRVADRAYPFSFADDATMALAEKTLTDPELPAALRRSLIDGTDRLRRAVRSQERFA